MDKCVCGYKLINGVCADIECPFEKSFGDNINIGPNIDTNIGPNIDPNIDPNLVPNK